MKWLYDKVKNKPSLRLIITVYNILRTSFTYELPFCFFGVLKVYSWIRVFRDKVNEKLAHPRLVLLETRSKGLPKGLGTS